MTDRVLYNCIMFQYSIRIIYILYIYIMKSNTYTIIGQFRNIIPV